MISAERRPEQKEKERRKGLEAQSLKPAEFCAKDKKEEKRVGTRWEARCYIETSPRRVCVVANAMRTQPGECNGMEWI